MNKLTQALAFSLVALLVAPTFNSCKKGEDDPTSLRSRKGRLTGEWTLDNSEMKTTTTSGPGSTTTSTRVSDESVKGGNFTEIYTETVTSGGTSFTERDTLKGKVTETFTFEKDGTFKRVMKREYTVVEIEENSSFRSTVTTDVVENTEMNGTWDFNDGIGDNASKQFVILFYSGFLETSTENEKDEFLDKFNNTTTTTLSKVVSSFDYKITGPNVEAISLRRLANKEMTADFESSYSYKSKSEFTSGTTTITSESNGSETIVGSANYVKK
jgi:hypothetical protein